MYGFGWGIGGGKSGVYYDGHGALLPEQWSADCFSPCYVFEFHGLRKAETWVSLTTRPAGGCWAAKRCRPIENEVWGYGSTTDDGDAKGPLQRSRHRSHS